MAKRPYIVGNWKMHGTRAMLAEARAIDRAAERLIKVEVALAPPYTLIHATRNEADLIGVGAQDCHAADGGAHTGDAALPLQHAAHRHALDDARAGQSCAAGESHGHADRVGTPVFGDVEAGQDVVDAGERKELLDLGG